MSVPTGWIKFLGTPYLIRILALVLSLSLGVPLSTAGTAVSREVLVLYNSQTGQTPVENFVFEACQMVLNYYGILPEYRDVSLWPLPDDQTMSRYRGIITIFTTPAMPAPDEYLTWLNRQASAGRKIIVLNNLGAAEDLDGEPVSQKLLLETYNHLGLEYGGAASTYKPRLRFAAKDGARVEFERKYPRLPDAYVKLKPLNQDVKVSLSIERTDIDDSASAVIVTSPSGGLAREHFISWMDPITFKKQWYLNPFVFFEEALDLIGLPRPDPTTLNGLRVAFSHIDADAFAGKSRIDPKLLCAEIIRDRILKKYDFPVTVSVIVGEISPDALGNQKNYRLAQEILALPNVEPASHSYSHPFYWDTQDKDKERYDGLYGLPIEGYTYDPAVEIDYSVKYVNEHLVPEHKTCQVFLWTGNCKPRESDIARSDALGLLNMNGGDTVFDEVYNSYTSVAPLYRRVGNRYQVHSGQANENILTNLWEGPFYGFRGITTTMQKTGTPRRVAPIDIYYHYYSAEYKASLRAVEQVYEWVMAQNIAPVFTSDYIRMVQGYLATHIQIDEAGHYIIEDYGHCLTMRFDSTRQIPDLSRCRNVLGYTRDPQGLYVSLAPGKKRAVIVMAEAAAGAQTMMPRPFVRRASGWVSDVEIGQKVVRLNYQGYGKGHIEISGLAPALTLTVSGSALGQRSLPLNTNPQGVLRVAELQSGSLQISWK